MKSSRATSRVRWKKENISGTDFIPIMGTESVPEMSFLNHLTRLVAREGFIKSCRRESFKSYKNLKC